MIENELVKRLFTFLYLLAGGPPTVIPAATTLDPRATLGSLRVQLLKDLAAAAATDQRGSSLEKWKKGGSRPCFLGIIINRFLEGATFPADSTFNVICLCSIPMTEFLFSIIFLFCMNLPMEYGTEKHILCMNSKYCII